MKRALFILFVVSVIGLKAQEPIIIDHNHINLSEIPLNWIDSAKANLHIGYGHTSHGSQLISGMDALESFYTDGTYNWSNNGGTGKLHLFEGSGYDDSGYLDHDCGYAGWDTKTRTYLDATPACNVLIWSWCGQVNDVDLQSHYLNRMDQLEKDYPNVTFVYMTGHLEGQGPDGSLFKANQKIRDYCKDNNKILFDFTDISKYDPDAKINYQQYYANDGCSYAKPGGGSANWANDWLAANPNHTLTKISQKCGSCSHSVSLNCVKKGIASWFLWARIAGWEGTPSGTSTLNEINSLAVYPIPFEDAITVLLPDKSNNAFVNITTLEGKSVYQKQINNGINKISIPGNSFPRGIYLLTVNSENKIYQKKLIK